MKLRPANYESPCSYLSTLLHGLVQQLQLDQICECFQIYLLFVGVLEVDWQNDECSATEDSECSDAGKDKIKSKTETQPTPRPRTFLHSNLSKNIELVLMMMLNRLYSNMVLLLEGRK